MGLVGSNSQSMIRLNSIQNSKHYQAQSTSKFFEKASEINQKGFHKMLNNIDSYSQCYSLHDIQQRIVKCFSQKAFLNPLKPPKTANKFYNQEIKEQSTMRPNTSLQLVNSHSRQMLRTTSNQKRLSSSPIQNFIPDEVVQKLQIEQRIHERNLIGSSPSKESQEQIEERRAQKHFLESRTLDQEKDDDLRERLRKQRIINRVDLTQISVPEALKILAEKRANLLDDKTKQFSLELERMIQSIDEAHLIQYLREEMAKKENEEVQNGKSNKKAQIVNQEIKDLQEQNNRIQFDLTKEDFRDLRGKVNFVTENDIFDDKFNKALRERKKILKEPWEKVRAVFKEKNLIKEKNFLLENVLMKKLKKRFKNKILECAKQLTDMKMDLKQFISDNVMPTEPYERPGSQKFINAAKSGDYEAVQQMIQSNKYFVYDFDHINQTALHWAAKRNHKDIVNLLIQNGANVNHVDMVIIIILIFLKGGRTALYLATKESNFACVKLLLAASAVPLHKTNSNKTAFDVVKESMIERYLTKAQLLYICLKLIPPKKRAQVWEKEGLYYFKSDVDKLDEEDG
ncbi:ankyrin repeat-containing protein [Stylonychia lemnae]|uniref:Ankyrin repeat-containing protein n=1 Tax=Stylonychia lemnae TaxID=5949 RepID=A0A078AEF7_STYLE|nr:ankyrin repeat-containing protein [Stylonychia lemnae]|eukprot:CDW80221.1 ankyrin repeat-containing protein [Stylonychia lemnae]